MKGLGVGGETMRGIWEKRMYHGKDFLTDAERSSLAMFDICCYAMERDRDKEAGRKFGSGEDAVYRAEVMDGYMDLYGSG